MRAHRHERGAIVILAAMQYAGYGSRSLCAPAMRPQPTLVKVYSMPKKAATSTLILTVALALAALGPNAAVAAASSAPAAPSSSKAGPAPASAASTQPQAKAKTKAKVTPKPKQHEKTQTHKPHHKKSGAQKSQAGRHEKTAAKKPKGDQAGVDFIKEEKSSQMLASSILSMSIQDKPGKDADRIGTVNDIIMDKDRKLVGIVVGVGGFLGMGQKNVGIPWSEVKNIDPQRRVAVVNVTKKQLQNAPAFATSQDQAHRKSPAADKLAQQANAKHSIFFDFGKSTVDAKYQGVIDTWAKYMKAAPKLKIAIQGRTDSRGSAAYNKILARQRAEAVAAALKAKGVATSRLTIKVMGKAHEKCIQKINDCRAHRRRVDLVAP